MFEFESEPHLYRSIIFMSVWVQFEFQGRTYINRSFSCLFEFSLSFGTAPISIGYHLVCLSLVWVSGPHLYRSVIHPICLSLSFGTAPISIGHHLVCLSLVWVSGLHLYWSVIFMFVWVQFEFQGRTHMDRSSSCQFELVFSFWDPTYIDRSSSYLFEFEFSGPHLYRSVIILSAWVSFQFLGSHLYRSVIILFVLV